MAPPLGLLALPRFSHHMSLPFDEIIMAQSRYEFVSDTSDEALESGGHIIDGLRFSAFFFFRFAQNLRVSASRFLEVAVPSWLSSGSRSGRPFLLRSWFLTKWAKGCF